MDRPINIPPPEGVYAEPFSFHKLTRLMAFFGPAAIAASVSIGAGETLVVVVTGAWAKYQLLWLVLLAVVIKGIFTTYLLGRYTAITGEPLGHRLARLPGPKGWLLILFIAIEFTIGGPVFAVIARPCGNLLAFVLSDILPGDRLINGTLAPATFLFWEKALAITFVVVAAGLSLKLSYERLEKQNLIICAILVGGTLLASVMIRPDPVEAFKGTVTPALPLTPHQAVDPATGELSASPPSAGAYNFDYLLLMITILGYVGNSVFAYLIYANWVAVRGWGISTHDQVDAIKDHLARGGGYEYLPRDAEQVRRVRGRLAPLRWDVAMGAVVLFVVTASFMMSGAQVLFHRVGPEGLPEWKNLLTEQRYIWQEINPMLVPVYYVCILAALWGTLNALPEIWARVSHEFLSAISPRVEKWNYKRFQLAVVILITVPAVYFLAMDTNLEIMAAFAATLTSSLAVAVTCGIALYINWALPPAYRPHWITRIGGLISTIVLSLAALGGIAGLTQKMGLW